MDEYGFNKPLQTRLSLVHQSMCDWNMYWHTQDSFNLAILCVDYSITMQHGAQYGLQTLPEKFSNTTEVILYWTPSCDSYVALLGSWTKGFKLAHIYNSCSRTLNCSVGIHFEVPKDLKSLQCWMLQFLGGGFPSQLYWMLRNRGYILHLWFPVGFLAYNT